MPIDDLIAIVLARNRYRTYYRSSIDDSDFEFGTAIAIARLQGVDRRRFRFRIRNSRFKEAIDRRRPTKTPIPVGYDDSFTCRGEVAIQVVQVVQVGSV